MITRFVVLVLVVSLAVLATRVVERSKGRSRTGLEPGLLLVTSLGCTLCGPAQRALDAAGVDYRMVDAAAVPELGIRSVPTLFLVDGTGAVVARRSGRAAILAEAQLAAWRS
jgi:glutaredoxin